MSLEQAKDIIVAKNKEALTEIIDVVLYPALQAAVANTPNLIDDAALQALGPALVAELKKIISHL